MEGKSIKDRWIKFTTIKPRLMMARKGLNPMGYFFQEGKEQLCVVFGETGKSEDDFWVGYFVNIFPNFTIISFSKSLDFTRELNSVEKNQLESCLFSETKKINSILRP
jgi:hypothetical protein